MKGMVHAIQARWRSYAGLRRREPPHQASEPIIRLTHVTVRYGDGPPALEDISFTLERGEQVAVVGPNGAGKSTLFQVIAGILSPAAGEVTISGHAPGKHACIAYVPQRSQVDWDFPVTVADVVMMGRVGRLGLFRWPRRRDHELVRESLRLVDMEDLAHIQIGELSGGQQQRVFIARALTQEAEILLMDEPFNGLDLPSRRALLEVLARLRDRKVTVMIATHDLNQASQGFDRLLLLNRKLIAIGDPATVLTPASLLQAYGGPITSFEAAQGTLWLPDGYHDRGGRRHD